MKNNKVLKMFLEKDMRNNIENTPLNKIYSKLLKGKDTICRLWSDTKPLFEQIKDKLQQIYFKENDFIHKQEVYKKIKLEPFENVEVEVISDLFKFFNIKEKPIRATVTYDRMLPRILVILEEDKRVFLNYFDCVDIINKINDTFYEIRTLTFCIFNRINNFGVQAPFKFVVGLPVK